MSIKRHHEKKIKRKSVDKKQLRISQKVAGQCLVHKREKWRGSYRCSPIGLVANQYGSKTIKTTKLKLNLNL